MALARAGNPVVRLVRLKNKRGIKLGGLKGKLSDDLPEDIAKPWSKKDLDRLFGRGLEP